MPTVPRQRRQRHCAEYSLPHDSTVASADADSTATTKAHSLGSIPADAATANSSAADAKQCTGLTSRLESPVQGKGLPHSHTLSAGNLGCSDCVGELSKAFHDRILHREILHSLLMGFAGLALFGLVLVWLKPQFFGRLPKSRAERKHAAYIFTTVFFVAGSIGTAVFNEEDKLRKKL